MTAAGANSTVNSTAKRRLKPFGF